MDRQDGFARGSESARFARLTWVPELVTGYVPVPQSHPLTANSTYNFALPPKTSSTNPTAFPAHP
jgi:hypothetical protein